MHFACLVVYNKEKELSEILEPFCEETQRSEYVIFYDQTKELLEQFKVVQKDYNTFEEFIKDKTNCEYNFSEKKYGFYYNPNAKWDWYVVGGGWLNRLKLKDKIKFPENIIIRENEPFTGIEQYCSCASKCDIDFDFMYKKTKEKSVENYEKFLKGELSPESLLITKKDGTYFTKEEYVQECSCLFNSLLIEEEWYSIDEYDYPYSLEYSEISKKLIQEIREEEICCLIDCHK